MTDPRCPACGSAMQRLDGGPNRKGWWCYPCPEREAIQAETGGGRSRETRDSAPASPPPVPRLTADAEKSIGH